jgi:hypothetical protein
LPLSISALARPSAGPTSTPVALYANVRLDERVAVGALLVARNSDGIRLPGRSMTVGHRWGRVSGWAMMRPLVVKAAQPHHVQSVLADVPVVMMAVRVGATAPARQPDEFPCRHGSLHGSTGEVFHGITTHRTREGTDRIGVALVPTPS